MRRTLLASALLVAPLSAAHGQDVAEEIVSVVFAFARDSFPAGPTVIATDLLRGRAALDAAVVDRLARSTGVAKRRKGDVLRCTEGDETTRRQLRCTLEGGVTMVGLSQPEVRGGAARMRVSWRFQEREGVVAARAMTVEVTRTPDGRWQVSRVVGVEAT